MTRAFAIRQATRSVDVNGVIDPTRRYDVFVSAATADGVASESLRCDLAPETQPPTA